MGHVLNYTLGRRRHALPPPQRLHGAAADGLRLVRPAGRERGDQGGRPSARDHRAEHRLDRPPDAADRLGDRLGPRGLGARADLLPLDAVAVPEALRARPRLPQGGAGQLVPERPDGALERARDRRPLRALRRDGRGAEHGAVVLQDHRVRRRAARGPATRSTGPSGRRRSSAALDRPFGGRRGAVPRRRARPRHPRLHDAPRHALRRDVLRRRARDRRWSTCWSTAPSRPTKCSPTPASPPRVRPRSARRARRPASSPAGTRSIRRTASASRSGSPTTC